MFSTIYSNNYKYEEKTAEEIAEHTQTQSIYSG